MPRLKHPELTLSRVSQFYSRLCGKIISEQCSVQMEMAGPVDRIPYEQACSLNYEKVEIGHDLTPIWSTHWLRVRSQIPAHWRGSTVAFRFHSGSEALLWLKAEPYHGFNHEDTAIFGESGRVDAVLPAAIVESGQLDAYVEIACNSLWGASSGVGTPTSVRYQLYEVKLIRRNDQAWRLAHDLFVPLKWLENLPQLKSTEPWSGLPTVSPTTKKLPAWPGRVLQLLNHFCNVCDSEDPATWAAGSALLQEIYAHRNATYAHEIVAIGHAHIDTAWLWPLAETKRKCVRSFSNVLNIMERHPKFRFTCSQAQQYTWMKELYPALYTRIQAAVQRGQWSPVGGTWIEPDCNVPSGESLVRQFLFGQRFFKKEFGRYCREFWNPDVFGYSGALPQIMRGAGIEFFLTQKLSWNQFNKPIHQNFYWEGIDGSRVLTHFPPADTYNALDADSLVKHFHQHENNAVDHDRVSVGMMLFGYGDGGGGPTHHMMEVIERLEDFQGFPRVSTGKPEDFFIRLKEELDEAPVMVGELYFEYHRGTYTTQAANKRDNRRCERLLRDVELLAAIGLATGSNITYPSTKLDQVWKTVLLNQFHDILPGSSIQAVYEDSARDYTAALETLNTLHAEVAQRALPQNQPEGQTLINTLGWDRSGLVQCPTAVEGSQLSYDAKYLLLANAPACGYTPLRGQTPLPVSVREEAGNWILENTFLRATFNAEGQITSLFDLANQRHVLESGACANRFVLHEDYPHAWDAWDVDPTHLEKFSHLVAHSARIIETGPLRAGLEFNYVFGTSRMIVRCFLTAEASMLEFACEVDWSQRHQFLKVEFPVAVRAPEASFEIQFGHVKRPTHFNTSHDIARFESSAHFWADLSEEGYGVALLNDCKYGYAVHGNVMRLSLLRGTTSPDPEADQGQHHFRYALLPHAGSIVTGEVVRRAQEFNTPWVVLPTASATSQSWFTLDSPHLILDTIKKAEDSDDLILRLYECHGSRGTATLESTINIEYSEKVNLLEEEPRPPVAGKDGKWEIDFKPFELITLKLVL